MQNYPPIIFMRNLLYELPACYYVHNKGALTQKRYYLKTKFYQLNAQNEVVSISS